MARHDHGDSPADRAIAFDVVCLTCWKHSNHANVCFLCEKISKIKLNNTAVSPVTSANSETSKFVPHRL